MPCSRSRESDAAKGVVTHSSGNHGAALAYAAARRGIRAFVVMPENAARIKQENVRALGATIRFSAPNAARPRGAVRRRAARDRRDADPSVRQRRRHRRAGDGGDRAARGRAGRSTSSSRRSAAAGLLSGTAIAAKGMRPGIRVFGAEPANADDASRGFRSGRVEPVSRRRRRSPTACVRRSRRARSARSARTSRRSARQARKRSCARCG